MIDALPVGSCPTLLETVSHASVMALLIPVTMALEHVWYVYAVFSNFSNFRYSGLFIRVVVVTVQEQDVMYVSVVTMTPTPLTPA